MSGIKEGDVVEVVGACCHMCDILHRITHVREVRLQAKSYARCCGFVAEGMTCAHLCDTPWLGWVPIAWLRKLNGDLLDESVKDGKELTV